MASYARHAPSRPGEAGHGAAHGGAALNKILTQAASLQELVHAVLLNFGSMNAVNCCTAYHRLARHVQDERTPPESWPPAAQQQLGGVLSQLNLALLDRLGEVQAHNLGLTLWSISKTHRLPQQHCDALWAALQAEVTARLASVSRNTYMSDKHYNFGPQSLSNIVYSAACMGHKPDYDLLHALSRAVVWQAGELKPQGLANILWGLGKLGVKLTHEVRQMAEALCREMVAQLTHSRHKGSFAPQNVSNSLHGLANIGVVPTPELLTALSRCADDMLRQFGPQELTTLVWSLSQMHRASALLTRIPDELGLLFGDRSWRARTISNLSLAYAHLGRKPQLLMALLMKEALPLLPQFKPQELSNLLWSVASMDFWPGPGVVEAVTRAAGAAAERMKPQELANSCWAWATMRFFPGAALLDSMLALAEAQLDRFKSQELSMLSWAMARLAYMPAATLVRAALHLAAEWASPAVQDVGNLMWACTVLGILTPEAMALLGGKLLALPRVQLTQEAYIQLYQAKMSLSQQVHDIARYIPAELLAQGETEWRHQAGVLKLSATHRDVAAVMTALGVDHEVERRIEDGLISVDLALRSEMVAVEVDGSAHFSQNEPFVPLGRSIWRWRLLASRGWRVVSVPYFRWGLLKSLDDKKRYLYQLLQCQSVWECYSLDPSLPDVLGPPPANLAHLSPDDVFACASRGVAFSSLVAAPATPAASPTTPLLSSLGPSLGRSGGTASGGFLPSLGLQSSGGAGLPPVPRLAMPLQPSTAAAGGLDAGGGSGAACARLPDSLFGGDSPRARPGGGSALNVAARPFTFGGSSAACSPFAPPPGLTSASRAGSMGSPAAPHSTLHAPSLGATAQAFVPSALSGSSSGTASLASSTTHSPAMPCLGSLYTPASQHPSPQPPQLPSLLPAVQAAAPRLSSPQLAAGPAGGGAARSQAPLDPQELADDSDDDISDLRSYFGAVVGIAPEAQQPQGPLSVEEVRRKLALLPAEQAVADVAPAWLAGWEAEQLSQLLRLLDSPTTAARAVQLFEWLRGLTPDSPLAHLCVPAAYATMIELHGRWRKPKQAVRLFAEAKERGEDAPEVHSALVEAFCRTGQYDVALDAYRNMTAQGLAPTPAALRAVLDLHTRRGSWEAADALLESWGEVGGHPDAELFDLVMERACSAGSTAAALAAFDRMCGAEVPPTPRTFTTLLTVLRRQHDAHETAVLAFELVGRADAVPSTVPGAAMGALHGACRAHGWCDVSLQLLAAVEEAGGSPGLELVNGVLATCAASGAVVEARRTFAQLSHAGLQPSADSYLHLVAALHGAGLWGEAAQAYKSALDAGLHPSAELASLAVDGLWCTGLGWAQARAMHHFDTAVSAGWLPAAEATLCRGLLKVNLRALHLGTGALLMRRWLASLRLSIGNGGAEACGQLDGAKRVCVVAGSAGGAAAAALASGLKDALGASLMRHGAPFRVTHEDGRAQRLETSAAMLLKWLFTEGFAQWEAAFTGAAALTDGGDSSLAARLLADAQLEERAREALAAAREHEAAHPPGQAALHYWRAYASRLGCGEEADEAGDPLLGNALPRLHQMAFEPACRTHAPSILAACAVYLGRKQLGVLPSWPSVLHQLTGYHEELHPEFATALRELQHTAQYGSTVSQAVFS